MSRLGLPRCTVWCGPCSIVAHSNSRVVALLCCCLQVGPGAPATADQPQSYDAELTGATWKLEREVSHGLSSAWLKRS